MPMLRINVFDRKDKKICDVYQEWNKDSKVVELMKAINKEGFKGKFDLNRMRLQFNDAKGAALNKKGLLMEFFEKQEGFNPDQPIKLVFKDLGTQVSWTTVFLVEYFGPILITGTLIAFQKQIYGKESKYCLAQKLGIAMEVGHYLKREFETLFVHRFSNDTMPFFNIFKNSFHYWILNGFFAMYFLLHPDYTTPSYLDDNMMFGLFAAFWFFELMNALCHLTLKDLRKPGTTERGVPHGYGFDTLSCANYFWESLCWITFSTVTSCLGAWLFTAVSFGQMLEWALKKHRNYKKEFGEKHKAKYAMIPFII